MIIRLTLNQLVKSKFHRLSNESKGVIFNSFSNHFFVTKQDLFHFINLVYSLYLLRFFFFILKGVFINRGYLLLIETRLDFKLYIDRVLKFYYDIYFLNQKWMCGLITNYKHFRLLLTLYELRVFLKSLDLDFFRKFNYLPDYMKGIKTMLALPDLIFIPNITFNNFAYREISILKLPVVGFINAYENFFGLLYAIPGSSNLFIFKLFLSLILKLRNSFFKKEILFFFPNKYLLYNVKKLKKSTNFIIRFRHLFLKLFLQERFYLIKNLIFFWKKFIIKFFFKKNLVFLSSNLEYFLFKIISYFIFSNTLLFELYEDFRILINKSNFFDLIYINLNTYYLILRKKLINKFFFFDIIIDKIFGFLYNLKYLNNILFKYFKLYNISSLFFGYNRFFCLYSKSIIVNEFYMYKHYMKIKKILKKFDKPNIKKTFDYSDLPEYINKKNDDEVNNYFKKLKRKENEKLLQFQLFSSKFEYIKKYKPKWKVNKYLKLLYRFKFFENLKFLDLMDYDRFYNRRNFKTYKKRDFFFTFNQRYKINKLLYSVNVFLKILTKINLIRKVKKKNSNIESKSIVLLNFLYLFWKYYWKKWKTFSFKIFFFNRKKNFLFKGMKNFFFFIKGYSLFFKLYRFLRKCNKKKKYLLKRFLKRYNKRMYGNAYYMKYYPFQRLQTRKRILLRRVNRWLRRKLFFKRVLKRLEFKRKRFTKYYKKNKLKIFKPLQNLVLYEVILQLKKIKPIKKFSYLNRNIQKLTNKLYKLLNFVIKKIKYKKILQQYRFFLYKKQQRLKKQGYLSRTININSELNLLNNKVRQHLFVYYKFQENLQKKYNKKLRKKYFSLQFFFRYIRKLAYKKAKLTRILEKRIKRKSMEILSTGNVENIINKLKKPKIKYLYNKIIFYPHLLLLKKHYKLIKHINNDLNNDKKG